MNDDVAHKLAKVLFEDESSDRPHGLPSIDGYIILQELGRGGSGVVYEGVVKASGRQVAIKILHTRVSKPANQALVELDRLASVRSSVVPHVFEHGWVNGQVFIVTERIDGVNPLEFVHGMGLRERVRLLAKIIDAVSVLHERGIIHRDLKPSNILITEAGDPVVIDLGISMLQIEGNDEATEVDTTPIGTWDYMAPEQVRGENGDVSTRWDVYALGVIGYQLLGGFVPRHLSDESKGLSKASVVNSVCSRGEISFDLPKPLEYILEKACSSSAADRYASAQLFGEDLRRWVNHEPVLAGPQSLWMRSTRVVARHPIISVLIVCVLIFAIAVSMTTVVVWWKNIQPYQFTRASTKYTSSTSILSRDQRYLHTWRTEDREGVRFQGQIIEGASGKYAILGLDSADIKTGHRGLMGYRLGEYDEPAWVAKQHVPPALSYAVRYKPGPHRFSVRDVSVADIFPEVDGLEILSNHIQNANSVCAIQVHSVDGKLLCEYYHDGWVDELYWNPVSRQIVATGPNSDGNWLERGEDQIWVSNYPIVIFALEPKIGELQKVISFLGLESGYEPAWYQCLMPGSAYWSIKISDEDKVFVVPHKPADLTFQRLGYVWIELGKGSNGSGHANMIVDKNGHVVETSATDTWSMMHGGLNPNVFRLEDLPARTKPRKYGP